MDSVHTLPWLHDLGVFPDPWSDGLGRLCLDAVADDDGVGLKLRAQAKALRALAAPPAASRVELAVGLPGKLQGQLEAGPFQQSIYVLLRSGSD